MAPSAVPLDLGSGLFPWFIRKLVYGTPREMTPADIETVIRRFAHAASLASEAGFAGVEVHAAPEGLNDAIQQIRAITDAGVDFVEISGGSIEDPTFSTGPPPPPVEKSARSRAREAFFVEFASAVRSEFREVPVVLTGGLRTRKGMEVALAGGSCDMIGLARPAVVNPSVPRKLLDLNIPEEEAVARVEKVKPWSIAGYIHGY
ncbi:hypothetical protein B0T21DRAFT_411836 [Apiosordaria backusii]|uniref:NADH:flavin oxidoreductase/NADH oxidase N-terminal domain-containing protein n=1 Tax=Apiosordaria backusii TaxID=314023 RepID=A0AA40EFQ2_9PEZI|nr:hypothetical protein B0T21DRAFT_411836 [Apiosordaria backusii]